MEQGNQEENHCFRTTYQKIEGKDSYKKIRKEVKCPTRKTRCERGVLKKDLGSRKAGSPCKDTADYHSERE